MIIRLLLIAALFVIVWAVACGGGKTSTTNAPDVAASAEKPTVQSPPAQNVTPVDQADPAEALAHFETGVALLEERQLEEAIAEFDEAIRFDLQSAEAYLHRGIAYVGLGQHQLALEDFDESIRLDPRSPEAYHNRGLTYSRDLNQFERGIQDFDGAIQLDSQFARAYLSRGLSYYNIGQHQRAIENYYEALRHDPELALAYVNRAIATSLSARTRRPNRISIEQWS